jgi:hypothetical protein
MEKARRLHGCAPSLPLWVRRTHRTGRGTNHRRNYRDVAAEIDLFLRPPGNLHVVAVNAIEDGVEGACASHVVVECRGLSLCVDHLLNCMLCNTELIFGHLPEIFTKTLQGDSSLDDRGRYQVHLFVPGIDRWR